MRAAGRVTLIELLIVIAIVVIVLVLVASWPISSYFEAKAWNELTGGSATTWQAMWVELRVDCQ